MNLILFIIGFAIALISCDSEVTRVESHHSPDGIRKITVSEELQGANDDSPWLTHISLTTVKDDSKHIPGNIIKLEGRGRIAVSWITASEVSVYIDDTLFTQVTTPFKTLDDIRITFRKASSRIVTQSEQAAPRNR